MIANKNKNFAYNKDMKTKKKVNKNKKKSKSKVGYFISFFVAIILICGGMFAFYQIRYPVKYKETIIKYADTYAINRQLVASLINEESSFNENAVSKVGAMGLMQITPSTGEYIAQKLGVEDYKTEDLFDVETNIKFGCYYLNYLREKFVDERVYLSAYNAGETTVSLWLNNKDISSDGVTLDKIPYNVTEHYTNRILNGMKHYSGRI